MTREITSTTDRRPVPATEIAQSIANDLDNSQFVVNEERIQFQFAEVDPDNPSTIIVEVYEQVETETNELVLEETPSATYTVTVRKRQVNPHSKKAAEVTE